MMNLKIEANKYKILKYQINPYYILEISQIDIILFIDLVNQYFLYIFLMFISN